MSTETEAIAALAERAAEPQIIRTKNGRELLILPEGLKMQDVSGNEGPRTEWIEQRVVVQTVDSMTDYVNRFKTQPSTLFADIANSRIVAILDYHGGLTDVDVGTTDHRAQLDLPYSEEWKTWTGISGRMMGQLEFARFIEENAVDIVAPAGADLLEVVRDLQARRSVNFTKAVRTASNNENFEFTDETEARTKGGIEIPAKFQLSIPVYFDEAPGTLYAFLRWHLDDAKLKLGVQLHRAEHVRQATFKQIVNHLAEATGCQAIFGRLDEGRRQ